MQLIGMLDSPYVRRVAVALIVAKVPFEHRPISLFRHIDQFSAINPLLKAPTLVADDGTVLIEFDADPRLSRRALSRGRRADPDGAAGPGAGAAPDRPRPRRDGEGGAAALRARLASRGEAPSAVGRPRHGPASRRARGARSRAAGSRLDWRRPRPRRHRRRLRLWLRRRNRWATWSMSAAIAISPPSRRAPRRFRLSAPRRPRTASPRRSRSEPGLGPLSRPARRAAKNPHGRRYTGRRAQAEE